VRDLIDKEHATWSASATERNWSCAGALALTHGLPETTSVPADWGTVAHAIAEECLRLGRDAAHYLGETRKGKAHEFEVDDEMVECVQEYIDYVRGRWHAAGAKPGGHTPLIIEQRFSLEALNTPFDAGGTADAVIYNEAEKLLEVIDLKTGKGGTVEVTENKQLRTYALGAVIANPELKIDTVKVTIVQTRKAHKDGRIRSEVFHVADLIEWTGELLEKMGQSKVAMEASQTMPEAAWAAAYLTPGNHCGKTFCKAQGFCPALSQKVQDEASVWFDDMNQPRLANSPDTLSPEGIAQALDVADMVDGWINAVRAFAHTQATIGVEIPNYVLVDKIGRRKWRDETAALAKLQAAGVEPYTRKIVSPAQAEKALGTKRKGEIADLVETPATGTNLVRADKTTRPAVKPVTSYFEPQM
jgi:hypothetical protein